MCVLCARYLVILFVEKETLELTDAVYLLYLLPGQLINARGTYIIAIVSP